MSLYWLLHTCCESHGKLKFKPNLFYIHDNFGRDVKTLQLGVERWAVQLSFVLIWLACVHWVYMAVNRNQDLTAFNWCMTDVIVSALLLASNDSLYLPKSNLSFRTFVPPTYCIIYARLLIQGNKNSTLPKKRVKNAKDYQLGTQLNLKLRSVCPMPIRDKHPYIKT